MGDGHDLRARRRAASSNSSSIELAAIVDGSDAQLRAFFLAEHLPRHDVGVVLHGGDEHFVAGADVRAAVGLRDQVDGLGGAADEDDLARVGGVDEVPAPSRAPPRAPRWRATLSVMHAAMNVGVVVLVVVARSRRSPRAAFARWRRCRDRRAAGRGFAQRGWGSQRESSRHRGQTRLAQCFGSRVIGLGDAHHALPPSSALPLPLARVAGEATVLRFAPAH